MALMAAPSRRTKPLDMAAVALSMLGCVESEITQELARLASLNALAARSAARELYRLADEAQGLPWSALTHLSEAAFAVWREVDMFAGRSMFEWRYINVDGQHFVFDPGDLPQRDWPAFWLEPQPRGDESAGEPIKAGNPLSWFHGERTGGTLPKLEPWEVPPSLVYTGEAPAMDEPMPLPMPEPEQSADVTTDDVEVPMLDNVIAAFFGSQDA